MAKRPSTVDTDVVTSEHAHETWADHLGTRFRINKARRHIPSGSRVLDIGCGDGTLFRMLGCTISGGVGVDPDAPESGDERFSFVREHYPVDLGGSGTFDVVIALAMLEHVPVQQQPAVASACFRDLRPNGRAILTVPSRAVDPILHVMQRLGIAGAETLYQHHGFDPSQTAPLFEAAGFTLVVRRRFELGLNNLFVFTKPSDAT